MSISFLVIILFILVILVFVLAFREPLSKLDLSALGGPVPSASAQASPAPSASPANSPRPVASARPSALVVDGGAVEPSPSPSPLPSAVPVASPRPSASPQAKPTTGPTPSASATPSATPRAGASPSPSAAPSPSAKPVAVAAKTGNQAELKAINLYFTKVDDDGGISIEKVSRSVSFSESPLVSSIRSLLKGPDGTELSHGYVSMIPAGTSLLKAWVQDGVAYLNFSESFMFNPLGADGLRAQVRQVVWVATEFPTVKSVQILIEGKKVDYLGGDNVPVGSPLTRQSLK